MITDAAGDLFGTTYIGGTRNEGEVFEIVKASSGYASTPNVLLLFTGNDGHSPIGNLVFDAAGDLFGTTQKGGADNAGVVFEIAKTSSGFATTPAVLATFNFANGYQPEAGLVIDASGDLFGTTSQYEGALGGVFEIVKTGSGYAPTPLVLAAGQGFEESDVLIDASGDLFATASEGGAKTAPYSRSPTRVPAMYRRC